MKILKRTNCTCVLVVNVIMKDSIRFNHSGTVYILRPKSVVKLSLHVNVDMASL